jgi:hypothetical protein
MTFTQHFQSYKKYIQGIIPTLNKWKGQRNNNILRNDVIAVVTNTGFGLAGGYKDGNEDRVVYTLHEEVYRKIKGSLEGFYKNGKKTQVYINKKNKETGETQQIPVTINLNGTTYNIYEGQQKNYYGVRGSDSNKDGNMTISEISNIYLKHQPSFVIYDVAPYLGRI